MIYLSATSINNYLSCSMRHFLRVNFKDKEKQTPPLRLGSLVHKVIEISWNNKEEALLLAEKKQEEYQLNRANLEKAKEHISTFYNYFFQYLSEKDEIEKEFKFKLKSDVILLGKLDRITPQGLVFDWKTSNSVPKSLTNSVQFIIYNYAYRKLYGKEPTSLFFASLKTGQLIKYKYDKSVGQELFKNVIPKMLSDIRDKRFSREGMLSYYSQCTNCTFKEFCLNELASGDNLINKRRD